MIIKGFFKIYRAYGWNMKNTLMIFDLNLFMYLLHKNIYGYRMSILKQIQYHFWTFVSKHILTIIVKNKSNSFIPL